MGLEHGAASARAALTCSLAPTDAPPSTGAAEVISDSSEPLLSSVASRDAWLVLGLGLGLGLGLRLGIGFGFRFELGLGLGLGLTLALTLVC